MQTQSVLCRCGGKGVRYYVQLIKATVTNSSEINSIKEAGFGVMTAHQCSADFILKHIIRI